MPYTSAQAWCTDFDQRHLLTRAQCPSIPRGEENAVSFFIYCQLLRLHSVVDVLTIYYSASDLGMMAMLNAKERGGSDWAALFREADEGYIFLGIRRPPSSQMSFIAAIWDRHNGV
jgi:hypothetical protein